MEEFDENGWSRVHHAAFKGHIANIDKLIEFDANLIELETVDDLQSTPLHLAIMGKRLETIEHLVSLGAKYHKRNSQGHGIIELACLGKALAPLYYFLTAINQDEFPTWRQLISFLGSDIDHESDRAAYCLSKLLSLDKSGIVTQNKPFRASIERGINPLWQQALANGLICTSIKVLLKDISLKTKAYVVKALLSPLRSCKDARLQFGILSVTNSAQSKETMFGFSAVMKLLQELSEDKNTLEIHLLTDIVEIISVVIANVKSDEAACLLNCLERKPNQAEDLVHDLLKSKILMQLVTLLQRTPAAIDEDYVEQESDPNLSEFDEIFIQNKVESNETSKSTTEHDNKTEFLWLRFWRQIILALTAFNNFDHIAQLEVAKEDAVFKTISTFLNLNAGICKESAAFEKLSVTDKILVKNSIKNFCKKSAICSGKKDEEKEILFAPKTCIENQLAIVSTDVAEKLIQFGRLKSPELQLSAVECLFYIGACNQKAQIELRERGAFIPLLSILKKGLNTTENMAASAEAGDELSNDLHADGKTIISSQFTLDEEELKSIGTHSRAISRKSSLLTGKVKSLSRNTTSKSESNKKSEKPKMGPENLMTREKVVRTIWTLVGDDEDIRRLIAKSIDVRMLIEFLESSSLVLQLVGAEALAELAGSAERRMVEVKPEVLSQMDLLAGNDSTTKKPYYKEMSQRETIGMKGGVAALVNLLRSSDEQIVIQACRTLSVLCADVGYVPIPVNQFRLFAKPFGSKSEGFGDNMKFAQSSSGQASVGYSGVRLLIALLLHAQNKNIQCEAGHALAMALLGQSDLQRELMGEEGSKAEETWDAILARLLYLVHTDLIYKSQHTDKVADQYDEEESDYAVAAKRKHFEEAIFLRLQAAEALTILAYEGTTQITRIGMLGGLRFRVLGEICRPDIFIQDQNWLNFLQSKIQPHHKCIAAFQIVILSRVMPDQEVVDSTSIALESLMQIIKMYVDPPIQKELKKLEQNKHSFSRNTALLREKLKTEWSEQDRDSNRSKTLKLAIDCVARLCKTRPGIPEGLRCLGICPYLARCLRHPRVSVRRAAAVSIAFILKLPEARRELIHCFRIDPYLMKSLQLNTKDMKLNIDFLDSWQHCQQIGLPKSRPIIKTKQSLANESSVDFQTDLRGRPISICTQLTGDIDWNELPETCFNQIK